MMLYQRVRAHVDLGVCQDHQDSISPPLVEPKGAVMVADGGYIKGALSLGVGEESQGDGLTDAEGQPLVHNPSGEIEELIADRGPDRQYNLIIAPPRRQDKSIRQGWRKLGAVS